MFAHRHPHTPTHPHNHTTHPATQDKQGHNVPDVPTSQVSEAEKQDVLALVLPVNPDTWGMRSTDQVARLARQNPLLCQMGLL